MEQSILTSTKKVLGLAPGDTSFDLDVLTHINAVLADLTDLGYPSVFVSDADDVWDDYLPGNPEAQNTIRSYMYLRVRLLFDPPTLGYVIEAQQQQIKEMEFRLLVRREATEWVSPFPKSEVDDE